MQQHEVNFSDSDLIERLRQDDLDALGVLFERYPRRDIIGLEFILSDVLRGDSCRGIFLFDKKGAHLVPIHNLPIGQGCQKRSQGRVGWNEA